MKFIFIDETGDSEYKDYFGLSLAVIDSANYKKLKNSFQRILRDSPWDETVEFKGSFLFSARQGDEKIEIEKRVDIAYDLLDLNIARNNARMYFYYKSTKNDTRQHKEKYIEFFPLLLQKALKTKAKKGIGKDLVSIICDYRNDIKLGDLQTMAQTIIDKQGYCLWEHVSMVHSNFHTVGILYADIIGYLLSRIDIISSDTSSDKDFFEKRPGASREKHGKMRKLESSRKLIEVIKKLNYEID